ncbi:unnamed protein product [Ectocarpus sp. CCAP 1310/34]|nr:unnamed protein product [Ectocarpus sp. CCAP 1310/34]
MTEAGGVFDLDGDPEGAEGHEGGSSLQAVLAASRQRAEAKSAQELQLELEAVRLRLLRRSQIIDALRSAYVRDVVIVKNELMRKSAMTDEVEWVPRRWEYVAQGGPGTDITDAVPSLDMRPVLALFSPEDAFLRIESCAGCGGHLEIVTKETKRVARLTKRISDLNEAMGETAKEAAQLRAELILTRHRVKELDERNIVNRDTLVAKLEQTQRTCEADVLALKEDARRSDRAWEAKMARKASSDEQLTVIPVLTKERDKLREELDQEISSREQDQHRKDIEIATLNTKVAHLESSAEADAKRILEARNKTEDTQRRLHNEKAEHAATARLLEEEKGKYERCRSRLETSQEHLADLNERFNEMRAEVEASAENAEEEAGEASDALAAAKVEIQRLRTVLGTSDAAAALEAATLKISTLSEELHAARSEAREANDALQEDREKLKGAQAELDKSKSLLLSKASMLSDRSRQSSDGGLSWAGSFEPFDDDELLYEGERQGRMSSAMAPGGRKYEQGKWAVEKWIALVRFRKAVDAHNAEVTRLRKLLRIAQGGEERSRLEAELEIMSSNHSLKDMEDAMHKEVAALKLQAAGQSDGGSERDRARSSAGLDDAAWEAKLEESAEAQRLESERQLADLAALHEKTVEGLRLELSTERENVERLESEAEESKEKLKRLAKLEKNKKGHNAMTEELKKMQEETGISVGFDSSLEFTSVEGDLSKEDEARLIEELDNARDEIKNIKMRQAMVTHELLGNIKVANAEVEMLKAALADMTAQRDARMDMGTLVGMGPKKSGVDPEEFQSLKEEAKLQNKKNASLKTELEETSKALLMLLEELRKACKETARAKAKVWNARDLERARSIPSPPKPTRVLGSEHNAAGGGVKGSTATHRPPQRGSDTGGGSSRSLSSKDRGSGRDGVANDRKGGGREGEGDRGGGKSRTADEEEKEAELEKRRQERAAQAEAKKQLAEAERQELEEFKVACLLPQTEGVALATDKLAAVQASVKEQFKDVFLELKEALEAHKKFVLRTRVEAREVTGKMNALETELDRLRGLHRSTQEELRGRSAVLAQTQQDLSAERNALAATRKELAAAQAEARDNFYFKEKNAVLQNQWDHAEISSRRAKQECEQVKWELQEQRSTLLHFRKLAEEDERRAKEFVEVEQALKTKVESLAARLKKAEDTAERIEQDRKSRLECLTSTASQVNGYNDPDLGLGTTGSTQTEFHCPPMTLRRSNYQATVLTRAASAGPTKGGSYHDGATLGFVCPGVDGRAVASERDLYSPGAGSAALLEMQGSGTVDTFSSSAHHLDAHSDSLKQLSFRSPAWAIAGTEVSLSAGEAAISKADSFVSSTQQHRAGGRGEAQNWGLWHEGGGAGGGADVALEGSLETEVERHSPTAASGRRPGTTSDCLPAANTPSTTTVANRPQTSPSVVFLADMRGGGPETDGGRRSPPRRMHSRVLLQSARDHSLPPPCGGAGQQHQQRRQGVASAPGTNRCAPVNISASCSSVPAGATTAPGLASERPRTSYAVLTSSRSGGVQDSSATQGSVPGGHDGFANGQDSRRWQRGLQPNHQHVIDLGVVSDTVPQPVVWGQRQLAAAAAAAAASGRSRSAGVAGWWKDGVTKGGVVLDARFAKVRQTLRGDVLDAAERAKLPLLQ